MLEATNKILYLCLIFFLAHSTCFNHRVKYIAKFIKSNIMIIFFSRSILFSIDMVVIRAFIQSNIHLALNLETIHLHDKSRHSEVFAIDILDNLGSIHL